MFKILYLSANIESSDFIISVPKLLKSSCIVMLLPYHVCIQEMILVYI